MLCKQAINLNCYIAILTRKVYIIDIDNLNNIV